MNYNSKVLISQSSTLNASLEMHPMYKNSYAAIQDKAVVLLLLVHFNGAPNFVGALCLVLVL